MKGPLHQRFRISRRRRTIAVLLAVALLVGLINPTASGTPNPAGPAKEGRPAPQSYPQVPVDAAAEQPAPTVDAGPAQEPPTRAPGGRYTVGLPDAAEGFVEAGDSGIEVAATESAAAPDQQIAVQVLDPAAAAAVGAPGLALRVTAPDTTDVTIKVPDDLVQDVIGADFDSRVVWSVAPIGAPISGAEPVATTDTTTSDADGTRPATQLKAQASPAGAIVMAMSGTTASDGTGSFGATALSPSSSWQMSGNTGSFTWTYPITAPPAPAGPAPNVALAYDSGSVDGRTGSTNNQTSVLGEGWDLAGGGFVERSYGSCHQDGQPSSGDLCWSSDNATVSFAGHSGTLVKDGGGIWRLQIDDGTKVERLTGAINGDNDGEYWKFTTVDGTQYFFGRNRLPGWVSGKPETGSVWTVPVFGNQAGEPCNTGTFATSSCTQAWRWNLDQVIDPHGNTETFYYDKQQNAYLVNGTTKTNYDMGGYLTRIDYAMRTGSEYDNAPARVVFDNTDRCESTTNCTQGNTGNWPDVPWDLYCLTTACTGKINPSFFVTKKLAAIRTQTYNGSSYVDVDKWDFTHTFPATGDGTSRSLWLAAIARTGYAGGTSLTVPSVTFSGTALQNRVWATDGLAPLMKYRINAITSETGATTAITYAPIECTPSNLPAAPESNDKRCFPQRWVPPAPGPQTERLDYFHKYVVTAVSINPGPNSGSPVETTNYDYLGTPAWKYTNQPSVPADKRTWSDYAG